MPRRFLTVVALCLLLLFTAGCSPKTQGTAGDAAREDQVLVYASIYPVYDFTKKIGGEKVQVRQIMPAGTDPHHFEPSAKVLADLSKADILIYNGAGMEPWIEKAIQALAGSGVMVVDTSKEIELLSFSDHEEAEGQEGEVHHGEEQQAREGDANQAEHHDEDGHRHDVDPHVWLNPLNVKLQGKAILEALVKADPRNESSYSRNYQQLCQDLDLLHQEYAAGLSKCTRKEIVVAHEAFGYLAKEFGLVQIPIRGLMAEAEPSPTKIKEIVDLSKTHKITHIFFESMVNPKVSEVIAAEIGAVTLELNPLDNLSQEEIDGGQEYFSVMRKNLENLTKALE